MAQQNAHFLSMSRKLSLGFAVSLLSMAVVASAVLSGWQETASREAARREQHAFVQRLTTVLSTSPVVDGKWDRAATETTLQALLVHPSFKSATVLVDDAAVLSVGAFDGAGVVHRIPLRTASGTAVGVVDVHLHDAGLARPAPLQPWLFGLLLVLVAGVPLALLTRIVVVQPLQRLRDDAEAAVASSMPEGEDLPAVDDTDIIDVVQQRLHQLTTTVSERDAHMQRVQHEQRRLLGHVGEGLLLVRPEGTLMPWRSQAVSTWFPDADDDATIWDLVGTFNSDAGLYMELGWDLLHEGLMPLDVVISQLPRSMDDGFNFFELDYEPIDDDNGCLLQVLVVITDITSDVERHRSEQRQKELLDVFERVMKDREGFVSFFDESSHAVEDLAKEADRDAFLRKMHALKASCLVYGLEGVVEACQVTEAALLRAPERPVHIDDRLRISRVWEDVVNRLQVILQAHPGDAPHVSLVEVQALLRDVREGMPFEEALSHMEQWHLQPLHIPLHRLAEHAKSMARRLGKGTVHVDIDDGGVRQPMGHWASLWKVMLHVVHNAVDHGLEPPALRMARKKTPVGRLRLSARQDKDVVRIVVHDDGRGVDYDRLQELAGERGAPARSRDDVHAFLFVEGVTTKDTPTLLSGHGLGLRALLDEVEALGGHIAVRSTPGEGTDLEVTVPAPIEPQHVPRGENDDVDAIDDAHDEGHENNRAAS